MATHDYVLANQSGSSFRSDLNNALAAIVSQNSNATEPATKYAYQYWVDTSATPALIKQRNAANDAWVTLAEVDGQTLAADGTNAKPGISFAADIDTGLKRNAANDLSIVTNGTQAITVDSSQNVGIGTTSFTRKLEVVTGTGIAGFKQSSSSLATTLEFLRNGVNTSSNNAIEISSSSGLGLRMDYIGQILGCQGIYFDTQTTSLSDYEEGSWTPTLSSNTAGTSSFVADSANGGTYIKIGKKVFFQGNLRGTYTRGTASGPARINGLPFNVAGIADKSGNSAYGTVDMPYSDAFDISSGFVLTGGLSLPSTTSIFIYAQSNTAIINIGIETASQATNGINIHFAGTYEVA